MNVFRGIVVGISAYKEAGRMLFSPQFRWFLFFPLLFLILLFAGGGWLVSSWGDRLSEVVEAKMDVWIHGQSWLAWVADAAGVLVRMLLKILWFFFFATFGGYIILILMSPVFSWISERTEARLTGREYPFSLRQLFREVFRGIGIAFRNLFFQCLISLFLLLCSLIPLVGLLAPFALFFVSAYFYGFSFMDYAIERKGFNVRQSVRYINKNMGLVIGVGAVFAVSLMIPWFSLFVCSFVSLLSVIAATVAVNQVAGNGIGSFNS